MASAPASCCRGARSGRSATGRDTVELPIAVDADQVPPSVRSGSVVDVYVPQLEPAVAGRRGDAGPRGGDGGRRAEPRAGFGTATGRRQLVLAVPDEDAAAYFDVVAGVQTPTLTVVRRS